MLGKRFDGHINLTLKTFHFSNGFSEASFPFCLPRPICAWRQRLPRSPLAQDWLRGRRNPGSTSVHYKTFAFFKVENSKALQLSVAPVADASTFGRFFKYALGTSGFVPGYANCTKCGLPSTASSRKPLEKRKRTRCCKAIKGINLETSSLIPSLLQGAPNFALSCFLAGVAVLAAQLLLILASTCSMNPFTFVSSSASVNLQFD